MLTSLAVWYLRKRKRSVLMGFIAEEGRMQPKESSTFLYNNDLTNVDYRLADGTKFVILSGKFAVTKEGH